MGNKAKVSILAVLVMFGLWFFFTPHLVVNAMESAAEAKDAAKLSGYVNFPALKDSLKAGFNALFASSTVKENAENPYAALGTVQYHDLYSLHALPNTL